MRAVFSVLACLLCLAAASETCTEKYFKIADESQGFATSCTATEMSLDPVTNVDLLGCQAACDALPGCNTVNFRERDPNFSGNSSCYRKTCDSFHTAVCNLFTLHKSRDVYTKACGADTLWPQHVVRDEYGLFKGMECPAKASVDEACTAEAGLGPRSKSCVSERYYKLSDEVHGMASSCTATDMVSDPVTGVDLAGCQAACEGLAGCNTVNYRVSDPNFGGNSSCYRKTCIDFETAVCTLFSLHKQRDVYTKASGAAGNWSSHVLTTSEGLFNGVRCPTADVVSSGGSRTCNKWVTSNSSSDTCDLCWEWSGEQDSTSLVRPCEVWERVPGSAAAQCAQYGLSPREKALRQARAQYLAARWPQVGVCDQKYEAGTTTCRLPYGNTTCLARDQQCHDLLGVLSAGWQIQPSADAEDICTMCPQGRYGHCRQACEYRKNFYWSNYDAGRVDVTLSKVQLRQLHDAFAAEHGPETGLVPQELKFSRAVLATLPKGHPLLLLGLGPSHLAIALDEVPLKSRALLDTLVEAGAAEGRQLILSTTGVQVYETCSCSACPVGTFQTGLGSTACTSCGTILAGSSTADVGSSSPQDCRCFEHRDDRFLHSFDNGTTACLPCHLVHSGEFYASSCSCPSTHYAAPSNKGDGKTTCRHCPQNARCSEGHVLCFDGYRLVHDPSHGLLCSPCPEGVNCGWEKAMGLTRFDQERPYPLLAKGYWAPADGDMDHISVYLCKDTQWCPGGPPGTCAPSRDTEVVGCAVCLDGTYQEGSAGRCYHCKDSSPQVFLICSILVGVVILAILVHVINQDMVSQHNATTACITVLGLAVGGFQTIAVFSSLSITWVEPLRTLFSLNFFSFDLSMLRLDCTMGTTSLLRFVMRQLMLPGISMVVILVVLFKSWMRRKFQDCKHQICNTVGTVAQTLFVSLTISALQPWICYRHPGNSGFSMVTSPAVLCFASTEHFEMTVVGILALGLVIVPFLALVTYATVRYAAFIRLNLASERFVRCFRFLFVKYKPERYYFGMISLFRGLATCLVPVLARSSPSLQPICMGLLLLSFLSLQFYFRPWRSDLVNVLDGSLVALLLLLLICASMSTAFDDADVTVGFCGTVIFVSFFAALLVGVGVSIFRRMVPRPYYKWFICHHKLHAAAQARILQLMLARRSGLGLCFIDSDHLTDLDGLFDVVRGRIGQLIVYMTSETLRRPWCAGEIAVTFCTHRRAIAVRTDSFKAPTADMIQPDTITQFLAGALNLAEYGLTSEYISLAYQWLMSLEVPAVHMRSFSFGTSRFRELVDALSPLAHQKTFSMKPARLAHEAVYLSSDRYSEEATATAAILIMKMSAVVSEFAAGGICALVDVEDTILDDKAWEEAMARAHSIVVLLSSGSLQSTRQLTAVTEAMLVDGLEVVPVTLPCFRFPTDEFFETELPKLFPPAQSPSSRPDVQIRRFFKRIAVVVSTDSSDDILEMQARSILARLRPSKLQTRIISSVLTDRTLESRTVSVLVSEPPPSTPGSRAIEFN